MHAYRVFVLFVQCGKTNEIEEEEQVAKVTFVHSLKDSFEIGNPNLLEKDSKRQNQPSQPPKDDPPTNPPTMPPTTSQSSSTQSKMSSEPPTETTEGEARFFMKLAARWPIYHFCVLSRGLKIENHTFSVITLGILIIVYARQFNFCKNVCLHALI